MGDYMYLQHHGILKQKWGVRHGPPYPLSGGDYSKAQKKAILKERGKKNSIYNKKHFDKTISTKDTIRTLSYDQNRTKNTDMFYAAYDNMDKHQYNALFNKKAPMPIYDSNGNEIGTGQFYKFKIDNKANKDIKVASEDSGADAFLKLYNTNRDFYNFVTDPDRMQSLFVNSKYRFKGYREARRALDRIRNSDKPKEQDIRIAYRMMNYVLPNDGAGDARKGKDIATQRAKLFKELKKSGYGAMLDTNDAIYGGFKANAPVIVFDMESISLGDVSRTSPSSKVVSNLAFAGKKFLGIDSLGHSGIKGMKWGVKNGPPYPLKESSKSYSEKKHSGLSDKQKKAIKIGAAVAGTALVAVGGYYLYKNHAFDSLVNEGKSGNYTNILTNNLFTDKAKDISEKTGLKLKDKVYTIKEDTDILRKSRIPGDTEDCSLLAMNFALRRIGLDVTQVPLNESHKGGLRFSELEHYFKNIQKTSTKLVSNISKTSIVDIVADKCKNSKDAVGLIEFRNGEKGHFTSFYKENGLIKYIDIQSGLENCIDRVDYRNVTEVKIARLDDLEVNTRLLLGSKSDLDIQAITKNR